MFSHPLEKPFPRAKQLRECEVEKKIDCSQGGRNRKRDGDSVPSQKCSHGFYLGRGLNGPLNASFGVCPHSGKEMGLKAG